MYGTSQLQLLLGKTKSRVAVLLDGSTGAGEHAVHGNGDEVYSHHARFWARFRAEEEVIRWGK